MPQQYIVNLVDKGPAQGPECELWKCDKSSKLQQSLDMLDACAVFGPNVWVKFHKVAAAIAEI